MMELSPSEALRGEILAQARRQGEELAAQSRREAEACLERALGQAREAREKRLERARAEAARKAELALSAVPVEAARMRLSRIDALLQGVHDEARRRLAALDHKSSDYREALVGLAAEAVARLPGDLVRVKLSPADSRAQAGGLASEIAARLKRPAAGIAIEQDPALADGGVFVADGEGRRVWDNQLTSRLKRLWPELRQALAVEAGLVARSQRAGGRQ